MKRGSTIFFLSISRCFGLVVGLCLLVPAVPAQRAPSKRANELTLAGLRPGRDTLAAALRRYKNADLVRPASSSDADDVKVWRDNCRRQTLRIESDGQSLIQEITLSALASPDGKGYSKCDPRLSAALSVQAWATGHGLRLGDTRQRVVQLYGPPNSGGPSVRGTAQLDFLYYAFDWAGPDVPQVLEVYCARDSGKVIEITLAFPSL